MRPAESFGARWRICDLVSTRDMSSLFDRIAARIALAPDKPLDDAEFPDIEVEGSAISYAPGAADSLSGRFKDQSDNADAVCSIIDEIRSGRITSVAELDSLLTGMKAIRSVDSVLQRLTPQKAPKSVTDLFWGVAVASSDYEAVKWGVAIGAIWLTDRKIDQLFVLARHGEFAIYAGVKLMSVYRRDAKLLPRLLALLDVLDGWAVIRVGLLLAQDERVKSDAHAAARIVRNAILNSGIVMEAALPLAKLLDLPSIFALAENDLDLFRAVYFMMDELTPPTAFGGIPDLPNAEDIVEAYFRLLEERRVDIYSLGATQSLRRLFEGDDWDPPLKNAWGDRCRHLLTERFDEELMLSGLREKRTRWISFWLLTERRTPKALPLLRDIVAEEEDSNAIEWLASLGDQGDLDLIARRLSELVDFDERAKRPMSHVNIHGAEGRLSFVYQVIVRVLARSTSPAVIEIIKRACTDFDPQVRLGACEAAAALDPRRVDAELRKLIEDRLADSPPYIAESAKGAIERIGP